MLTTGTLVRVTTAAEAAALDARAISAGTPASTLMKHAGLGAAAAIVRVYPDVVNAEVNVYVGPGNNGGDGWVVARALVRYGASVFVHEAGEARTDEAKAERALALPDVTLGESPEARVVVDALLGVRAKGAPRGEIAECIAHIARARDRGAAVVSLDIPSGVDADTGTATDAVLADLTVTFGTLKRGLTIARGNTGRILVIGIGLGSPAPDDRMLRLVDAQWVRAHVPPIHADAHKGTRRKLIIIGGQLGMAGAPMLAARAAIRSGIGMVRLVVARENLPVAQAAVPEAPAHAWPESDDDVASVITGWADAVVIGPGLGASYGSRALVERVLREYRGPVVLDADALNAFAGEAEQLGALIGERQALLTPHPAEFGRLHGAPISEVLARRFEIGADLATRTRATVLLKGVPTVISNAAGERLVSCAGTPVLAAAGSGDLLSGIAGTLIAQIGDARIAGACAAWVHGRAAEIAGRGHVRGVTFANVDLGLRRVWYEPLPALGPVLADLPAVGER
ncbi:MAG TPA: NAD(P)H-hydrate dehydratase [Gemmatimonadaceae bacterium]|nr:NAD(P)H-hydrate dehydratase [Gemmatimonadaceae bacterium]